MAEANAGLGDWLVAATATCALAACVAGVLREAPSLPAPAEVAAPAARTSWVRLTAPAPAGGEGADTAGPSAPSATASAIPEAPGGLAPLADLPALPEATATGRATRGADEAAAGPISGAPSVARGGPVRLGRPALGGDQPWPDYPAAARRRGEEGTVTVRLSVDAAGAVTSAAVAASSGWRSLDEAAAGTVRRRWSFPPGEPRDYLVDIRFELL